MTTAATKPVIVIVPGSWHTPAHYAYLALRLNAAGYTVDCVELASTDESSDLLENPYQEDVAVVRNAILSHTEAGRDVAVVMHSYGGVVGSEAAAGLEKKAEDETTGGVVKLVYMAARLVDVGWTFSERLKASDDPIIARPDSQNPNLSVPLDPGKFLYHDVPEHMSQRAIDNLKTMRPPPLTAGPSKVGWHQIPPAYIACEDDVVIPIAHQEQMISMVEAQGVNIEVVRLKSGHSPFLSMPIQTAKAIRGFLGE